VAAGTLTQAGLDDSNAQVALSGLTSPRLLGFAEPPEPSVY